ncbi:hypothetical protein BHE74_00053058 [Ensete ventricosum]|nr:hypothetical protein BHE74_00053058 [Ensete ventricosum]RZR76525.1 hypothetical protein BHM03_00001339 [Ensete ventricosum]
MKKRHAGAAEAFRASLRDEGGSRSRKQEAGSDDGVVGESPNYKTCRAPSFAGAVCFLASVVGVCSGCFTNQLCLLAPQRTHPSTLTGVDLCPIENSKVTSLVYYCTKLPC